MLRVEGHLTRDSLELLRSALRETPHRNNVALDLSGVHRIDAPASEYLASLRRLEIGLIGASMYVRQMIEEAEA
ncbi:MAG: STAS domain-containing protein [Phycisphaerales bacterium]